MLRDNGGDDLSVSANGAFSFATLLASGAAYNVTVASSPAGQSCTVGNGSGTVGSANVTSVAVSCVAQPTGLGSGWTAVSDGGLAISNGVVVGTNAGGVSGDIRTGESYGSDQYSQVLVTSTALTGGQWIGPAVRAQNGGQDLYLGLYSWNGGSPELMLFKRISGAWTQLGSAYPSGPLAAGTQLKLTVVGSSLVFSANGVDRITAADSSLTGGAPGIMAYDTATLGTWTGGNAGFEVDYLNTDATGIQSYNVISDNDGYGPQTLRVLQPTHPAAGVPHNFLYVLPVEAGLGTTYGDGLQTLQTLDAEDQYNLTIIEPSFYIDPWYANASNDPNLQYETFMTNELVPWAKANLSTNGTEQNWLIGFSKSGIGGQDLILKHPDVFTLAASWDFPADMNSYDEYGPSSSVNYGLEANFETNYELTSTFVGAHKAPFLNENRIWIGGYSAFPTDISDYDSLLTSQGIAYTTGPSQYLAHRWDSGWVPAALAGLYQDSINLPPSP